MFGINFTRNGDKKCTQVIAAIATDLDIEKSILCFDWECGTQYAAELLRIYLDKKYHDSIKAAHKKAYEEGYKDGRGRKRKKLWFSGDFTKSGRCSI